MHFISIHAPPRGATIAFLLSSRNPRISIHAPPRGATQGISGWRRGSSISIHAPPRGATITGGFITDDDGTFQFTPLREGRLSAAACIGALSYFNSRPSARGDWAGCSFVRWIHISIHAPPRGATGAAAAHHRQRNFNSRPSARGDHALSVSDAGIYYFNSRPSARGDDLLTEYSSLYQFQFTPLREGRRVICPSRLTLDDFNSRPSARGDEVTINECI